MHLEVVQDGVGNMSFFGMCGLVSLVFTGKTRIVVGAGGDNDGGSVLRLRSLVAVGVAHGVVGKAHIAQILMVTRMW